MWLIANAAIQGDPLSFMTDTYSNAAQTERARAGGGAPWEAAGDLETTGAFVAARLWPFLIPVAAILVVRALERRLARPETAGLLVAALSVPIGLIAPLVFLGQSFGWLRFFMYPLFIAAGWGVYEVAASRRRTRALAIVASGWLLAIPATLITMSHRDIGLQEQAQVATTLGRAPVEPPISAGLAPSFDPIARTVEHELHARKDGRVLVDSLAGWPLRLRVAARHVKAVLTTEDRRFRRAVRNPYDFGVTHVLVPDPAAWAEDTLVKEGFWEGEELGFRLVRRFPPTSVRREEWRLFALPG